MAEEEVVLAVDEQGEAELEKLLSEMRIAEVDSKPKWTLPEVVGEYAAIKEWPGYFLRPMKARQELQLMELTKTDSERSPADALMITLGMAALVLFRADIPNDAQGARDAIIAHVRGETNIFKAVTPDEIMDKWTSDEVVMYALRPVGLWRAGEEEAPNE